MQLSQQEKDRLRALYQKATYEVWPFKVAEPLILRPGAHHPEIDAELEDAKSWMFITAHNPFGQPQPQETNIQAQRKLHLELKRANKKYWPGRGYDPQSNVDWEEPSIFVFPVSRSEALDWASKFDQLAILYGEPGNPQNCSLPNKLNFRHP